MGQDNLVAIRRDAFAEIAISNHKIEIGRNRTRAAVSKAIDPNWIIEITCVQREDKPYYLAVVLNASSGKTIGWAIDRTLEDAAGRAALRSALLQQPNATPGASFQPPNPVLGPPRRLASIAQD